MFAKGIDFNILASDWLQPMSHGLKSKKGKRLIHRPGQQQNKYVSIEKEGIVLNEVLCKQEK